MIDSHSHLADKKFDADLDAVLERASAAGVNILIAIGDDLEESQKCIEIAESYENIFCTVGVHPHKAAQWDKGNGTRDKDELKKLAMSSKKVVAIGEIGLDYHYNFSAVSDQRSAFGEQLLLAKELEMPCVVHCREAVEDIRAIVDEIKPPRLVLHCCTEKWEDVEWFVDRGDYLSFTGIATYPNAQEVRRTIERCPIEQMMIETDSPYLAPIPHRGKRNEPAFVVEVARAVAKLKGLSLEETDALTTKNTVEFFGLSLRS